MPINNLYLTFSFSAYRATRLFNRKERCSYSGNLPPGGSYSADDKNCPIFDSIRLWECKKQSNPISLFL